ncbi:MAG: YHS domain-containing protein [Saprospiraceae bacterium]
MKARTFLFAGSLTAILVACQNSAPNKVVAKPYAVTTSPIAEVSQIPVDPVDPMPVKETKPPKSAPVATEAIVFANKIDEVCGMEVQSDYTDTCHYKGKVYGFCSEYCRDKFKETPLKYLSGK